MCDVCGGDGRVPEQPCAVCDGRGQVREERTLAVDVPAGIADGQRIRLSGRGHAGERGGPNGDLYVVVRVREDERFVRDQEDLHTVIDVAAPLAALGTTVQVPSLDGDLPGRDPRRHAARRDRSRCARRGLPPLQRGRTGDLHVHVNVVIPRRLSREQRDLTRAARRLARRRQPARRTRACSPSSSARWPDELPARSCGSGSGSGASGRRSRSRRCCRCCQDGAEETEPDQDEVEYALYAPRAELPQLEDIRGARSATR